MTLSSTERLEAACLQVDVFAGDLRLPVATEVISNADQTFLRILSNVPLLEPVATVIISAGCGASQTRRYTVLVEPPPEVQAVTTFTPGGSRADGLAGSPQAQAVGTRPPVPVPPHMHAGNNQTLTPTPARLPQQGTEPFSAAPDAGQSAVSVRAKVEPSSESQGAPGARRPSPRANRPVAQPSASKARLVVEPIDLSQPPTPVGLKSSVLLDAQPSATAEARTALTALWQSLQRSPEEQVRQGLAIERLSEDVKSMRRESLRLSEELAHDRKKRADQFWLVAAAAVMLIAAVAFSIGSWLRTRRVQRETQVPWWGEHSREQKDPPAAQGDNLQSIGGSSNAAGFRIDDGGVRRGPLATNAFSLGSKRFGEAQTGRRSPGKEDTMPLWRTVAEPAAANDLPATDGVPAQGVVAAPEFSLSLPHDAESLSAGEVIDINQQAEFFVSLGQVDHAILLLRDQIEILPEPPPLLYVDLLALYHQTNSRDAFDRLREQFQVRCNVEVPEFDAFLLDTRGLADYPRAIDRICALWPSQKVQRVIEESLMKNAEASRKPFTLAAYQDLLFLHALIKNQFATDGEVKAENDLRSSDFGHTRVSELSGSYFESSSGMPENSAWPQKGSQAPSAQGVQVPRARGVTELDIDLVHFEPGLPELDKLSKADPPASGDAVPVAQQANPANSQSPAQAQLSATRSGASHLERPVSADEHSNWIDFDAVTSTFESQRSKQASAKRPATPASGFGRDAP